MKPHTKVYLKAFSYDISDFIPCEVCQAKAVDIHHIRSRKMGGTKQADTIQNLMALCRSCHIKYGDKKLYVGMLEIKHKDKMNELRVAEEYRKS